MYSFERVAERATAKVCACSKNCQRCGGRGFIYEPREETFSKRVGPKQYEVASPCPCRLLEKRVRRYNEANIPGVLAQAGFESYRGAYAAQDRAKKVASAFALGYSKENPPKG